MILPLSRWRKSFSETLKRINPARHLDISKSPWVDVDPDQQEQAVANQQPEAPTNQQDQAAADQQDRVVGERRFSSSSTDVTAEREGPLANPVQQDQAATDQQDDAATNQQEDTGTLCRFPPSSTSITAEKDSLLAKQNQDPSRPDDDEFADLLTDLTLATAYANLMNNTPIINPMSAVSFLAFFYLVWWIWASQTIYNVRFRTRDFMHRSFAVLQFVIFGTMATFTSNFSIFSGILPDDSQTPTSQSSFN